MNVGPRQSYTGRKLLLSFGLIIVSAAYAIRQNQITSSLDSEVAQTPGTPRTVTPSLTPTPAPRSTPNPEPTPVSTSIPSPTLAVLYANGLYTGDTFDAFYGLVQVKVIIEGGKITHVQFLHYPNDRSTSRDINNQAMPLLTQEAIQAQSANVDGISGATLTSGAFKQSLASALTRAKNK